MNLKKKKSILVVCMGNVCRSPTAEAVLRAKAISLGIDVDIDSAGTIGFHQGEPPDRRAKIAGEKRGYCFDGMTAREIQPNDFVDFDWILAADKANLTDLQHRCPRQYQGKLSLFLSHVPQLAELDIPDPYYGGPQGFERVLDLLEVAAEAILKQC